MAGFTTLGGVFKVTAAAVLSIPLGAGAVFWTTGVLADFRPDTCPSE